MAFKESEIVELKQTVVDDIKKEIVAFANCSGGTLYVGVRDDGSIAGIDDADGECLRISNMVRDSIKPDVTMFVHYETVEMEGKSLIKVEVNRGTFRPYYLSSKGMRPEGVYVRQGNSSVPASDAAIRAMIKESDGDVYEEMRSLEQDLTFEGTSREFAKRKVEFGAPQMRTMKLIDEDGLYTNLGLLLSDQCSHSIKIAVFQGDDAILFKDRREFGGSLFEQMNEGYAYIDLNNSIKATFEGLLRIDVRDYPETALREAFMNLLVHRDYSYSAPSIVNIYHDRMEFISIGGLPSHLSIDDLMLGLSVCRNQALADVFFRLSLIEAYGTGMKKIFSSYEGLPVKPSIEVTKNAFKITLPNVNAADGTKGKAKIDKADRSDKSSSLENEEKVLGMAKQNGKVRRSELVESLGISVSTAARLIKSLVEEGRISQVGKGRSTYYVAAQ